MSDDAITDEWHRANEDLDAGRFQECAERLRRVLQRDQGIWEAHGYLADVLKNLGEWDAAIAEYREAIRINPADARTRAGLAEALSENGEGEQAIIECLEALRLNPSDWGVHYTLSGILHRFNMWDAALFECREALRAGPTQRGARAVRFGIGVALFDKAIGARKRRKWLMLRQNVRSGPARRGASDTRDAWLAAREALKDYDTLYPGDPEALTMLGHTLWALGERSQAMDTLWRALEADPSDPLPYSHLARHLLFLGKWKGLARLLQRAWNSLNTDPRFRRMRRMERLIDRKPSGE